MSSTRKKNIAQLPQAEQEKINRRRKKNRETSQRYRNRITDKIKTLKQKKTHLERVNQVLRNEYSGLVQVKAFLEQVHQKLLDEQSSNLQEKNSFSAQFFAKNPNFDKDILPDLYSEMGFRFFGNSERQDESKPVATLGEFFPVL